MRWEAVRWNIISVLIVSILSVNLALAVESTSEISVTAINNQISLGEAAEYKLTIHNKISQEQKYSVFSLTSGQGWNVDPYPLRDKVIVLPPRSRHTTTIRAEPLEKFTPGIYYVSISVESISGERYEESLKVYLGPEKPKDYLPTIRANIEMDDKIDPQESVSAKLFIENRNPLDLSDLVVKIQSEINEFSKEIPVNLPGLGKKTVEFTLTPSRFQQPKDYKLFFVFEHKGEIIKVLEKEVSIVTILPPFETEYSDNTNFFKILTTLKVTNSGNVLNAQEVKYPVSFLQALFTRSNAETRVEDGERFLVWEVELKPNESADLTYATNYRILFYLLLLSLVALGFYYYAKSPAVLKKKAVTIKSGDDGALSEIKITLELSNRSKSLLQHIDIIDVVPAIANVEKSLELGTVKPKEIRHGKSGTKVVWSLAECDAHEHRLITYKIRAKLNILGTFSLPRATVAYSTKRGRKRKAYSNLFKLG